MRISYALALALAATAVPAIAQSPDAGQAAAPGLTVAKGAPIFSADGHRLGVVYRVRPASVQIIYKDKFVEIPTATLSSADKGYATTLKTSEIGKL